MEMRRPHRELIETRRRPVAPLGALRAAHGTKSAMIPTKPAVPPIALAAS